MFSHARCVCLVDVSEGSHVAGCLTAFLFPCHVGTFGGIFCGFWVSDVGLAVISSLCVNLLFLLCIGAAVRTLERSQEITAE